MKSLIGKTVLVTGAAGGVGSVLAKKFYFDEKSSLILLDRDIEKLKELKSQLPDLDNQKVKIFQVDLLNKEEIELFTQQIKSEKIDVFVSNAGIVYSGAFETMDFVNFETVIQINLLAAVQLTLNLLPKLTENNGHIVFVASGTGLLAPGGLNAYSTSKYGLVGFSEALRAEVGDKIGVSTICPAFIKTEIIKNSINAQGDKNNSAELEKLDKMVQIIGSKTDKVCNIIIKSIKKNRGLVPVGFITKLLWYTKRFFPFFTDYGNKKVFNELIKRGFLS